MSISQVRSSLAWRVRQTLLTLAWLTVASVTYNASASSGGINSTNCTGCHTPQVGSATATIQPASYSAGSGTYVFSVSVAGNGTRGGFSVGSASGTFAAGTNSQAPGQYVTHTSNANRSWTFSWSKGSQITLADGEAFSVCALAAGGSASTDGDATDCSSRTLVSIVDPPEVQPTASTATANEGQAVSLNANLQGSTGFGAVTYAWVRTAGPAVTINNATAANASFTAPSVAANATLTFQVTATDSIGQSDTESVSVAVNNSPTAVASAAPNPVVEGNTVTLTSAASTDVGGSISSRAWQQIGGTPTVTLTPNSAAIAPTFTAPDVATVGGSLTLTFRVTVTDNNIATDQATVVVTVNDIAVGSSAPTVNAGVNQSVNHSTAVALSGTATDSNTPPRTPLNILWSQLPGGAAVTLQNATTLTPSFSAPVLANGAGNSVLTFQLSATNTVFQNSTDTVQVTVNSGPIANAGADQLVNESIPGVPNTVTLLGGASSDLGGNIASFSWVQVAGAAVQLSNSTAIAPTFTAPGVTVAGATLEFELTVVDDGPNGGLSSTDRVVINVRNVNQAPVADAGVDQTVAEGAQVALDGSNSSDVDDQVAVFTWTQVAGPTVTLTGANTASPSFVAPEVQQSGAALTFRLRAADAQGLFDEDDVVVTVTNVNRTPNADAGPDQSMPESTATTLSGVNSTDDEGLLSFTWQQTGGSAVTLDDPTSPTPRFTTPATTIAGAALMFTLRVTDQEGLFDEDDVIVNVMDVNTAPISAAGADQTVNESVLVTLDGSNSSDPDAPLGQIVSYAWSQVSGPAVSLTGANTVRATFVSPVVAPSGVSLTFQLRVTDDAGAANDDTVIVNVVNVNQPPVANAGPDRTVSENQQVMLDGSNSFDPDTAIATFMWSQTAGPAVALSNPAVAQPTFQTPFVSGNVTLTFQLRVTDPAGLAATDSVSINVVDLGGIAPSADAGPAQTVDEGALVTLDASRSSDIDGSVVGYRWRQVSGPSATLTDPLVSNPMFSAPSVSASGATLVFEVTVTDNDNLAATASVMITVSNVVLPPTANAGPDVAVTEGRTVTLNASASGSGVSSITAYQWQQLSGTPVTLSNPAVVAPTFVAPAIAAANTGTVVTFQVTVTNEDGLMAADAVSVTVQDNGITSFANDVISTVTSASTNVGIQPQSGNLVVLRAVDPATIGDQRNRPFSLPIGLLDMQIRVAAPGATTTVVVLLDAPAAADAVWVKYRPSVGFVNFSSGSSFSADRMRVTLTLTDGGAGDDDGAANGVIVDPGGLGVFTRPAGSAGPTNGGLATSDTGGTRFGCSLGSGDGRGDGRADLGLLLLLGLALWQVLRSGQPGR